MKERRDSSVYREGMPHCGLQPGKFKVPSQKGQAR